MQFKVHQLHPIHIVYIFIRKYLSKTINNETLGYLIRIFQIKKSIYDVIPEFHPNYKINMKY